MKRLILLLAVSAALLAPAGALASGVVLKVQRSSHLVAVTQAAHVALVHTSAAARLHVGQRVALTARTLRNGTLAAAKVRVVGRAHSARFRGLLLAKTRTQLVVSAGGAVISIHRSSRATASARDTGPVAGSTIAVMVTITAAGDLDEDNVTVVTAIAPGGSLEGRLTLGTGTVTVSSEHMTLVLNVPTGLDLTGFMTGDEVLAVFVQQADGTLSLTQLSRDDDAQQADDDDNGGHDGHHGGGGGGGGGDGGGGHGHD
jgi:Cu/Ag efflux protein CusF